MAYMVQLCRATRGGVTEYIAMAGARSPGRWLTMRAARTVTLEGGQAASVFDDVA